MAPKRVVSRNQHIDVVEQHIISFLEKMQHQNKRLQEYIKKTGAWTHMKRIDEWKPFDFFNYFCNKYQDKYRKQYRLGGSLVRAYQRIEDFIVKNNIDKSTYKTFIDRAFDRYFNGINTPHVAHIISLDLYNFLLDKEENSTVQQIRQLDSRLVQENQKFDEYMRKNNLYGYKQDRTKAHAHV